MKARFLQFSIFGSTVEVGVWPLPNWKGGWQFRVIWYGNEGHVSW